MTQFPRIDENASMIRPTVSILPPILALGLMLLSAGPLRAEGNPENDRLDASAFQDGLRNRGLIELLEVFLDNSPPADDVEAELLRRDILLATFDDATRPEDQRTESLQEADNILRQLIKKEPQNARSLRWRLDLATSLLYRQGEPFSSSILYRGGTPEDRRRLAELMDEAVAILDDLLVGVQKEFERLDALTLAEYERAERSGHIESVEQMEPQGQYLKRWALFYRAIARPQDDLERNSTLTIVATELRDNTKLLTTPHDISHYQVQSLLLSGMCWRRLGDFETALDQLGECLPLVDQLPDPMERNRLRWAATLARLERIRALRDAGQYTDAINSVDEMRSWVSSTAPQNVGLQLVVALLESTVLRRQAAEAGAQGNEDLARRLRAKSLAPLSAFARKDEEHRDAVYAALYAQLEPGADPSTLHPLERCAMVAGLLGDAEEIARQETTAGAGQRKRSDSEGKRIELLDRSISEAESMLSDRRGLDAELKREVLYNLGVARYRRGLSLEAAQAFIEASADDAAWPRSETAASFAVQVASELAQTPSVSERPEVRDLLLTALENLVKLHPDSTSARYWRFFLAQELERNNRFEDAAKYYDGIGPKHEQFAQARYRVVRCLARAVTTGGTTAENLTEVQVREAIHGIEEANEFLKQVGGEAFERVPPLEMAHLSALTVVLKAELQALPGVAQDEQALVTVERFEERFPEESSLIGRVLRVRIIAFKALNRLTEARQVIAQYVLTDPEQAGATLQSLLDAVQAEVDQLNRSNEPTAAREHAAEAVILAEQIVEWSKSTKVKLPDETRHALRVQLGEAYLSAGQAERARDTFHGSLSGENAKDGRAIIGLAESSWQLGQFHRALSLFNDVYRQSEPTSSLWWQALLGDLRCRTEMAEDPEAIIKVIRQQRFLHPEMGGEELKGEFERLLQQNELRTGQGTTPP